MKQLELGRTVMTTSIATAMKTNKEFATFVNNSFKRYQQNDWGELDNETRQMNNDALANDNERIHAVYDMDKDYKIKNLYGYPEKSIWIITEWDRSVTTVFFPGEY